MMNAWMAAWKQKSVSFMNDRLCVWGIVSYVTCMSTHKNCVVLFVVKPPISSSYPRCLSPSLSFLFFFFPHGRLHLNDQQAMFEKLCVLDMFVLT